MDMARPVYRPADRVLNRMVRRSVALDDRHRLEWWDEVMIASCRSVLPDGDAGGAQSRVDWRYFGTVVLVPAGDPAFVQHRFRHAAHPGYRERPCFAHVADSDLGPELCALSVDGHIVPVPHCHLDDCRRGRHQGPHQLTVCVAHDELVVALTRQSRMGVKPMASTELQR